MKEELKELSKGIGKAVETVPELYQDAFQPSAQEVGKLAGRVPRVINALLSNVDIWTLKREYAVKEAQKLLELKLEHIDQLLNQNHMLLFLQFKQFHTLWVTKSCVIYMQIFLQKL